jgi:hypothetical protein
LRCTCEVVFARAKSEKGLKDVIPQRFFGEVQAVRIYFVQAADASGKVVLRSIVYM